MNDTPSLDYRCSKCGARRLYELVPVDQQPLEADVDVIQHEIPSLDFRCSRCGASQTYKLVPGRAMESTS